MTRIPAPPRGMDVVDQAMGILAEETGVNVSELSDETDLAGLGVDSLLSLTISGRFREDLNVRVESTIFAECPNVKDLKHYFLKNCSPTPSTPESLSEESASEALDDESITSVDSEEDGPIDDVITSMRLILAQELGVPVEQITDTTDLAELGMDSLMTLTVTGRMRDELNMEVAIDLFAENESMIAIANTLGITPKLAKATPSGSDKESLRVQSPLKSTAKPAASSILLQGNPKTSTKTLWLFPDGSGSATSYAALSRISNDVTVYGLNCPYMKTPQDLTCSLDGITSAYLKNIRSRQPHGPYYLGGWSAGGVGAFDAAQQLMTQGEEVSRLILLDSPFPIGITKLPSRLYDFFNSVGVLGSGEQGPPDWLIGHFHALVEALSKYHAVPFAAGKAPKTHVIWATDGLCKFPDSPRPELGVEADPPQMQWLLENRTDFGPNGWDSLLGGRKNLVIETLEGVNHFSMMQGENARSISQFIARAMA